MVQKALAPVKVTLVFELPDERSELMLALRAGSLASALNDIYNAARGQLKHGDPKDDRRVLQDIKATAWVEEL